MWRLQAVHVRRLHARPAGRGAEAGDLGDQGQVRFLFFSSLIKVSPSSNEGIFLFLVQKHDFSLKLQENFACFCRLHSLSMLCIVDGLI